MAISTIGGSSASSGGGLTAPAGFKTVVAGYSSTGSYTTTLTGGEYYFVAPAGSTLSCNGNTYPGYVDYYQSASNTGPIPMNPSGSFIRVAGTQQVSVTVGPMPVTARLGQRQQSGYASRYNRNAVRFANSVYAFPDTSNNVVWTSTDAISWTSNATTFAIGNCFMVANGVFFAGDTGNSNILYTSTNGTSWTQRTMPTANIADGRLSAVVYSGGRYVAFFRRGAANTYAVHTFTSTDAITWTYGAQVSGTSFTTNAGDVGVFVAANSTTIVTTGDGGTVNVSPSYSTNGTSWTSLNQFPGANQWWDAIEFVGNSFVTVTRRTDAANGNIWYSSTGQSAFTNWGTWPFGLYGNGQYVTGINHDGTSWVLTTGRQDQNNANSVIRSTSLGGGWSGSAPFGWDYSTVAFQRIVYGSCYVNGRWFFTAPDFRFTYNNNSQTRDPLWAQSNDVLTFLSTGAFPTLQAPGSFGLYRLGDTTPLN